MGIQTIQLSQIRPATYNPRKDLKPGDVEYDRLKRSILEFGAVEPMVWNKTTGNLVGGHQRFKVLQDLGYKEAEVVVVDLPLDKEKNLNLALNKIQGDWDEEKLAALLKELSQVPDFDTGLTGFELPEISEILDRQQELEEDRYNVEADVDAIDEPVTQEGDLIELGPHRILCGDSERRDDLLYLLGGDEVVQLIHTDPPYNVDYYGGNRPHPDARPKPSRHWQAIYADHMTQEDYEQWLRRIFDHAVKALAPGAACYVWNGHQQFGPMHHMLATLNCHVACVITWAKPNFAIGYGDYNQQTEFCLYGWRQGEGAHRWFGPTNESTLWEVSRDPTKAYVHPTQKPIALAQRAIRNSSVRGDVVLDLFLGSGSTLIAAESLGRRCYGLEIDPKYCDAIVRRYIAYVGVDRIPEDLNRRYLKKASDGKS